MPQPKKVKFEILTCFAKRNFNRGFELSFVGTMEISPDTKSEQPRVAGKATLLNKIYSRF